MTDVVFALESDIGEFLTAMGPSGPGFWKLGMNALLNNIAQTMLIVGVAIATIFLIFGGIKWIVSGGDKEAAAKAQKTITAAIVGLVIIFLTWAIVGLIKGLLGIPGYSKFLMGGGPGGGKTTTGCIASRGIGEDGPGGCCGTFISTTGKTCDSGGCRTYETCAISNSACASGISCRITSCKIVGNSCSGNWECCSGNCTGSVCR